MNEGNNWLLVVPVLIGFISVVWGLFKHVSSTADAIKSDLEPKIVSLDNRFAAKVESNYNLHEVKIDALRDQMEQRVERVAATESKARHDMVNALTAQMLKLEQQITRYAEAAVRKEDFGRVERTLETLVIKLGDTAVLTQKVDDLNKRFDKFLDAQERRSVKDVGD